MTPTIWNAEPIHLASDLDLHVSASAGVVTSGKTVNNVYASDLKLTPDQARAFACALIEGADKAEAAGGAA